VITAVAVRVQSAPQAKATRPGTVPDFATAPDALRSVEQQGTGPTVVASPDESETGVTRRLAGKIGAAPPACGLPALTGSRATASPVRRHERRGAVSDLAVARRSSRRRPVLDARPLRRRAYLRDASACQRCPCARRSDRRLSGFSSSSLKASVNRRPAKKTPALARRSSCPISRLPTAPRFTSPVVAPARRPDRSMDGGQARAGDSIWPSRTPLPTTMQSASTTVPGGHRRFPKASSRAIPAGGQATVAPAESSPGQVIRDEAR